MAAAFLLLPVMNGDYLYTIQDNSVFIKGRTFMVDMVSHYGGWVTWLSCYLTQFFYHPWLGSTLIILLWLALHLLTSWLFNLKGKWSLIAFILPLLLMFNLLDYGYGIYYAKTPGFAFQPTLLCGFVIAGASLVKGFLRLLKVHWADHPITSGLLCALFFALSFTVGTWKLDNHRSAIITTLTDKNFKHEMKMYRALDDFDFEAVLNEMTPSTTAQPHNHTTAPPTNLMVLYKNIALMHTGRITDMFKTDNCGINPYKQDTTGIHISQLGAPLIYYQFGQINYSYRWAMENSVVYGQSFRNLKMMARCAIFNQEFDVAMKYLALLKHSIYYRKWALEREAWMTNSTLFIQHKEFQTISPLLHEDINQLDNDEGRCEKYLLDHFSDLRRPTSSLLEDVILCLSLWTEDGYAFCIHFYEYVQNHPNETIPPLYQQGAILYGNQPDAPITTTGFKFDATVSEQYNRFAEQYNQLSSQNLSPEEMAARMKPTFGDTYWWYYYFYTDFTIY